MFLTLLLVSFVIGVVCLISAFCSGESVLFKISWFFGVLVLVFFCLAHDHQDYEEIQRYELQDYSLSITDDGEKLACTTYDGLSIDVSVRDIIRQGNELVLVKYQARIPIFENSICYDLILPVDLAGKKAG